MKKFQHNLHALGLTLNFDVGLGKHTYTFLNFFSTIRDIH